MENLRQALKLLFLQKSPQEILGKWSKGGSADAEIDREDLRLRYSDDYRAFTLDQSDCAYQHLRNVWMHAPDNSVLHFAGRGAGADKQGTDLTYCCISPERFCWKRTELPYVVTNIYCDGTT